MAFNFEKYIRENIWKRICISLVRKLSINLRRNSSPPRVVLVDDKKTIDYVELEEDEDWITPEPFTPSPEPSPEPSTLEPSTTSEPYIEDFAEEGNYRLYDILWSDGRASQHVRQISDGVIPIAICVIPTNWLDDEEKARFVSLTYISNKDPENGSLTANFFSWGESFWDATPEPETMLTSIDNYEEINQSVDPTLEDYWIPCICKDEQTGKDLGYGGNYGSYNARYDINNTQNCNIKDLRIKENWLYTLNYCKENPGKYAICDIDGKQNTINISVEGNYHNEPPYNYDMKSYITQYAPKGTTPGEWYIPALGELLQFKFRLLKDNNPSLNDKVLKIYKLYPKYCISSFSHIETWSSTVKNGESAFSISNYNMTNTHSTFDCMHRYRYLSNLVVAFLQR